MGLGRTKSISNRNVIKLYKRYNVLYSCVDESHKEDTRNSKV